MRWKTILLPAVLIPMVSNAAINLTDSFTASGFGSFSATQSDNQTPILRNRDITDDWCYDCDSTLGLQLDWQISSQFRSSVQVVKRPQDPFSDPELEWAYVAYDYDNFTFRAGRLRLPLFIMSEYYYVSYAYPWFRPPQDIYDSLLGITSFNGISATWEGLIQDEVGISVTPFWSIPDDNTFNSAGNKIRIESEYAYGLNVDFSYHDTIFSFSALSSEFKQTISGVPFPVRNEQKSLHLVTLGIEQYWEGWHILAETLLSPDNYSNWYISIDYPFETMTPYVTYSQQRVTYSGEQLLLGVRYDYNHYIAFNLETQYFRAAQEALTGHFTEPLVDINDHDASIITLGVSFAF